MDRSQAIRLGAVAALVAGAFVAGRLTKKAPEVTLVDPVGRYQLSAPHMGVCYRLDTITGEVRVTGIGAAGKTDAVLIPAEFSPTLYLKH